MKLADYERMLPSGDAFQRLKTWVLNYCGEHYFWDMQLVLDASEVPSTRLGSAGRLGWTTWLKTQPFTHDADDLILNPPRN
jgi:type VI secretion system protein ImpH